MNKKHQFIYKNIYSYDIPSCHYNILKNNSAYDISHIDPTDKLERNTAIGMMMRNDRGLTKFLRSKTKEIIDFYIENNFVKKSDIILRQYDGFYSTRSINLNLKHDFPVSLELKNLYDIFIFSVNMKMYLGFDCRDNSYLIKGISSRYPEIDKIYRKILNINFLNTKSIVQSLKKLKLYILNSDRKKLFMIPTKDNKYRLILKEYGELVLSKKAIDLITIDDIDKELYFKLYFELFFKAIIYEIF